MRDRGGAVDEVVVVARVPDQTGAGRLAERDAEA
jgi:hypothetical protein